MSQNKTQPIYLALMSILTTTGFLFFSLGEADWWILLWLAPLPVLLYAFSHNRRLSFIVASIAYALGQFFAGVSMYYHTPFPLYPIVVSAIMNGVFFGLCVLFTRALRKRIASWLCVLAFASAWTSYQILWAWWHHGDLTNLNIYSQVPATVWIQTLAITGVWGLSFILNTFSAALALAWYQRHHFSACLYCILVPAILLALSLGYGEYRLLEKTPATNHIQVGLAVSNPTSMSAYINERKNHPEKLLTTYLANAHILAQSGAHYILQPEKTVVINKANHKKTFEALSNEAKQDKATLFVGTDIDTPPAPKNALLVFNPEGKNLSQYNKMHLVPSFERYFKQGTHGQMLQTPNAKIALAICHDMDFLQPTLGYGQHNANIVFVPASDFGVFKDAKWHLQMSMLNSVSNGLTLVRSALFGYLTIANEYGEILANTPSMNGAAVTLTARAPVANQRTFYAHHPDVFISIILTVFVLLAFCLLL